MENVTSEQQLYKLLVPALKCRTYEYRRELFINISILELWTYLKVNIWSKSYKLTIYEIIDDIFALDAKRILNRR